jgi:hypothetical protein
MIYGVGSFVAPAFGVSGLGLIGEIGPPNHLGDHLSLVNLMGDRVSQVTFSPRKASKVGLTPKSQTSELRSQGNMAPLGLAQGSWVSVIWVLSNDLFRSSSKRRDLLFSRLQLRYSS